MRAGRLLCKCEKDNFDCIMRNNLRGLVINAMISLNLRQRLRRAFLLRCTITVVL